MIGFECTLVTDQRAPEMQLLARLCQNTPASQNLEEHPMDLPMTDHFVPKCHLKCNHALFDHHAIRQLSDA